MRFIGRRRIAANAIAGSIVFAWVHVALPSPSAAQGTPWEFAVTPYLWATGIKARVSPARAASAHHLDAKFSDIVENLDGVPVVIGGEVRNGRFGLVGDLLYLPVAARIDTRNLLFNDGRSEMSTLMVAVAGFYRVADGPDIKADVGAGFRLWSVSSKARLNAGLLPAASARFDKAFADPIVAVRASLALSERWSVTGYLDLGAFDISSSELTWQLSGTVNYRAADWIELRAGWRHLEVKRDEIKLGITGPMVGATFRF